MKCVKCGGKTFVYNTLKNGDRIYRQRKCLACKASFYTLEKPCLWNDEIDKLQEKQRNYYKNRREKREAK